MSLRSLKAVVSLLIACVCLVPTAWAQSTLDTVQKRGTLVAGVRFDMPPFGYIGDSGATTGIDIAIMETAAKKLGVKLELKQVTAQTRIPMLQNGTVDVLAAGLAHTIEREKAIDFTVTYFESGTLFLVKEDSPIKSYKDLAGKTVATIQGTPYITGLQKKLGTGTFQVVTLQEYPQAVLSVANGKVDALMADDTTLLGLIKQTKGLKMVGNVRDFPRWHLALGVRHNDSKWRNFLNEVLAEMWEAKQLQEVVTKMGLHYEPAFEIESWKF
jgi:polar amino acid transport system substrate-binding protein